MMAPWGPNDTGQGLLVHPHLARSPHAFWMLRKGRTEGLTAHFRACAGSHIDPWPLAGFNVALLCDLQAGPCAPWHSASFLVLRG